ncbi:hypothetical protein SCUP515_03343 [Seiridium cupressi]
MHFRRSKARPRRSARTPDRFLASRRDGMEPFIAPSPIRHSSKSSYEQARSEQLGRRHKHIEEKPRHGEKHYFDDYRLYPRRDSSRIGNESFKGEKYPVINPIERESCGTRFWSPIPSSSYRDSYTQKRSHPNEPDINFGSPPNRIRRDSSSGPNRTPRPGRIVANQLSFSRASDLNTTNPSSPPAEELYIPLGTALACLDPEVHASFWSIENFKNWAKDPEVIGQDRKRKGEL